MKPKLLVFASGSAESGGSGFENLVLATKDLMLDAEIVGVVSNHGSGGVRRRAEHMGIPFTHFRKPWSAAGYLLLAHESGADFFALSGWLKRVEGLDPRFTFNIHPGPLLTFGGRGMYGHRVHEAVMAAYQCGEVTHSAVCMHFVTSEYDRGPCFFRQPIKIREDDTPESLAKRVNAWEHWWQPKITNLVVHREITWDGHDPDSLQYPHGYKPVRCDVW